MCIRLMHVVSVVPKNLLNVNYFRTCIPGYTAQYFWYAGVLPAVSSAGGAKVSLELLRTRTIKFHLHLS